MEWLVWTALGVAIAAFLGGWAVVVVRALEVWRTYKRLRRAIARGLAALEARVTSFADNAARDRPSPELERALTRLGASNARLAVLRRAIDDVTDAVANVTAVYPRK